MCVCGICALNPLQGILGKERRKHEMTLMIIAIVLPHLVCIVYVLIQVSAEIDRQDL